MRLPKPTNHTEKNMCKIKINHEEKALVNTKTGAIKRPSCFDFLAGYHSYLVGRGYHDMADDILKRVFKDEKVITDMIEKSQRDALEKKEKKK